MPSPAAKDAPKVRKRVRTVVASDGLSAMLVVAAPKPEEDPVTVDEIRKAVSEAGVVYGIDDSAIEKLIEDRAWDKPTKFCAGKAAQKGNDSTFDYEFETDPSASPHEGDDGRIDYRKVSLIQNVRAGEVLCRRQPPTEGLDGTDVRGETIKAPRGRDIPFDAGENTVVSDDGLELRAKVDGSVVISHGKVSVKDVITYSKDIDFNVGDIETLSSVRITGHVKAGFTLKVGGNLEINGNVEDATIECDGNILVKGGFFGGGEGTMRAAGDITLKYAEGQKIVAGNDLTVGGELLNCRALAKSKIQIKGGKGKIVGGEAIAGKEIRASVIGSDAGTPTKVTIALDAELMREHQELTKEIERVQSDSGRVKERLYELVRLQMDGKLTPQAEAAMKKLEEFQKSAPSAVQALTERREAIAKKLEKFRDACVIVSDTIYPGVQVSFGIVYRSMTEERTRCKMVLDCNQVMLSEFRDSDS